MGKLTRFSVSLDEMLLDRFDEQITAQQYPTRSKAVADLIRDSLVQEAWKAGKEAAAAIVIVYDHHKPGLTNRLTHVQHDYHDLVIASQHVHLDHDNCLEIVVVRGQPDRIEALANRIKATKGVKYCSLAPASTGQEI